MGRAGTFKLQETHHNLRQVQQLLDSALVHALVNGYFNMRNHTGNLC